MLFKWQFNLRRLHETNPKPKKKANQTKTQTGTRDPGGKKKIIKI